MFLASFLSLFQFQCLFCLFLGLMALSQINCTLAKVLASSALSNFGGWKLLTVRACHTLAMVSRAGQYKKSLPSPAISLYSIKGKELLDEATKLRTAEGFLEIATNLTTQKELTLCGLSSLSTVLNALLIDPQRVWKGSWRWYDETLLADSERFKRIEAEGLSFAGLVELVPKDKVMVHTAFASDSSLQEFRELVHMSCSSNSSYILANYFRPLLGQMGKGHFSPIGAYNPIADAVLIMDVARFKYPPHWVPCESFWNAMAAINTYTGKSRGFVLISKPQEKL